MSKLDAVATHQLGRFGGRAKSRPTEPATFVGLATLTTSRPDLSGPYSRPVSADLLVDRRGHITVTTVHVEPAQLGSVTCVISLLPGTGRGRYTAGKLQLTLGLLFRIDVLPDADSDITLTLATDPRAPRTDHDGRVTAAGTASFEKGYLGGRLATLVVTGAITPQAAQG
jgi:hypothetical protein